MLACWSGLKAEDFALGRRRERHIAKRSDIRDVMSGKTTLQGFSKYSRGRNALSRLALTAGLRKYGPILETMRVRNSNTLFACHWQLAQRNCFVAAREEEGWFASLSFPPRRLLAWEFLCLSQTMRKSSVLSCSPERTRIKRELG